MSRRRAAKKAEPEFSTPERPKYCDDCGGLIEFGTSGLTPIFGGRFGKVWYCSDACELTDAASNGCTMTAA